MFGRQLMLPPASVRNISLPEGIEDEELITTARTPSLQPSTKPSAITFFAHAVKLCQIVGEVLDAVYGGGTFTSDNAESSNIAANTRVGSTSSLTDKIKAGNTHEIFQLDAELTKWRDNLPSFLQISTYATTSDGTLISPVQESNPFLASVPQDLLAILNQQAKVLQAR